MKFSRQNLLKTIYFCLITQLFCLTVSPKVVDIHALGPAQGFQIQNITNRRVGHALGFSVRKAGDFNGDGLDDVIFGTILDQSGQGIVHIVYGSKNPSPLVDINSTDFSPTHGVRIHDSSKRSGWGSLGYSVSHAGDINGDGIGDVVVGAPNKFGEKGVAYVVYGSKTMRDVDVGSEDFSPNQGFRIWNTMKPAPLKVGIHVSNAGDVNGDGVDDVIVGASSEDSEKGAVYVIFGNKTPIMDIDIGAPDFTPSKGFRISDSSAIGGEMLGISVGYAGDVNGDNISDIIIGATEEDSKRGAAYVIYGTKTGITDIDVGSADFSPSQGFRIWHSSGEVYDLLGMATSGIFDINGDKIDDIAVGVFGENNHTGKLYVIYGKNGSRGDVDVGSATFSPNEGIVIYNSSGVAIDRFGYTVDSAGDMNRDGIKDIIVGAWGEDENRGSAYVIYGRNTSFPADIDVNSTDFGETQGYQIIGSDSNEGLMLGLSVSSAGDVNGDTFDDLIVGAYGDLLFKGAVHVLYFGKCADGCATCTSPLTCQACTPGYLHHRTTCINPNSPRLLDLDRIQSGNEKAIKATDSMSGTTSLITSLISIGNSIPLRIDLASKMVQRTRYFELAYTDELKHTFSTLQTNAIHIPAPNSLKENTKSKSLPLAFAQYGISSSFLTNYWSKMFLIIIGFGSFLAFALMRKGFKHFDNKVTFFGAKIMKYLGIVASNFALIHLYGSLDDIVFFTILDWRATLFNSAVSRFSFALSLIFTFAGIGLVAYCIKFLARYQEVKKNDSKINCSKESLESFKNNNKKMKILYRDFRDNDWTLQAFLVIFIVRSMVSALIYATLFDYPIAQITLLLLLSTAMIAGLVIKRPFVNRFQFAFQMFLETVIFVVYLIDFIIAIMDAKESHDFDTRAILCTTIIVINYVLILGSFVFLFLQIVKSISEVCKAFKSDFDFNHLDLNIKPRQITPLTSMNSISKDTSSSPELRPRPNPKPSIVLHDMSGREGLVKASQTHRKMSSFNIDSPRKLKEMFSASQEQIEKESPPNSPPKQDQDIDYTIRLKNRIAKFKQFQQQQPPL